MAFIDDFLSMMPSVVKVAPLVSTDTYGVPTYGPDVPYKAHIANKSSFIRGPNGETIVTKGTVWMNCTVPLPDTSRITFPDGSTPPILMVNQAQDETGDTQFTRIDFG